MPVRRPARTNPRVDLVLAAACGVAALVCLVLPASSRSAAAASLRTTVVAPLASMQVKAELARRAFLAHDVAARLADSVTLRSQLLTGVEYENDRLRKLLGLGAALKWGFIPAEALQGRGLGDDFSVTLSAGRSAGVDSMSPVVTTEGLVGMVERVDNSFSLAIFWPHPDFRVSAMSADGSVFGIVTGHLGEGATRYYLELHSVPLRTPLKAGALVVSSGLGGVYPRGLPIGVVVSEMKTTEGFAKSYLLRPMVSPPDISSVFILTPARVRAGVENVWSTPAKADSARKAIVGAGDSVRRVIADSARKAAAAAADSARKAAGDSLRPRRDTIPRRPPPVKADTGVPRAPKLVPAP
ncbi:MAG: rod shape-determining protein MreC [Gemmatimonadaceae bacterium]